MECELWDAPTGTQTINEARKQLDSQGCCRLQQILEPEQLEWVERELALVCEAGQQGVLTSRDAAYGIRNLLQLWPGVVDLVKTPPILEFVRQVLGNEYGVVRVLYFDKPPGRTWTLPWHRDRTIAVREHMDDLGEFQNPTIKAGIPHLVAPLSLLRKMVTLRFSIDPMCGENGPLVVIPKSHRTDADFDHDLNDVAERMQVVHCRAGDVFAMRPLLAHSSLRSADNTTLSRRVIHIELCSESRLPGGLQWHEYVPLGLLSSANPK